MKMHPFAKFSLSSSGTSSSSSRRNFVDKPKNRRAWLFVALVFPILILLMFTSAPRQYLSIRRLKQRFRAPAGSEQCKYGTVYVYDLPPSFNKKLLDNCRAIDPQNSLCDALSNDGFGPKATDLQGIIPEDLTPAWYATSMFAGEVIYHTRISNYKCRTYDPDSAAAFYIPFYAGLAIAKYLYANRSTESERESQGESLVKWVTEQPSWKRSNGADHFIMLGRVSGDFRPGDHHMDAKSGSSFVLMPPIRQTLRLALERSPWDRYEIGVPYPTGFHPRSNAELEKWLKFVRTRNRSKLFTFVGGKEKRLKDDFRGLLVDQCRDESDRCAVVDCSETRCSDGSPAILEPFLDSNFCLQPRSGDSFTRRSTFNCMLAGSIPVFFWKRSIFGQYDWFLRDDPERFSVFIDEKQVRNGTISIRKVLEGYGIEEIQMMRERVTNLIPRFLYVMPGDDEYDDGGVGRYTMRDAVDIAVEGVLRRFKELRLVERQ
ncbi:xyloglucan galactosyltransferase XLT2-like [Coffea eugenioides]|uniref:xyloglucan galactosyltransferase XLT2-like n=1 Tax=Coffea eugenioides TaxID=49369 RepID=UPI000F610C77|nr:xyloglucan galactosyltransferase XLT2-like [Coffea eugenioides]